MFGMAPDVPPRKPSANVCATYKGRKVNTPLGELLINGKCGHLGILFPLSLLNRQYQDIVCTFFSMVL